MKKILLTFMLAVMAMVIHAATFTQGDFIYEIVNDSTCNLSGLSSAGSGKTYLKIGGYTFNASTQKYCKVQKINQDAFENNFTITEVRIGPGVEVIANYAFYNCTKLQIVSLPSTIQSLGNSVFYNCPLTLINCAAETMPTFTSYTFNGLGTVSGSRSWWTGTKAGKDAASANSTITSLFSVERMPNQAYDVTSFIGSSSPNSRSTVYAIVTKAWSPVTHGGGECKIIYASLASQNTTATLEVPYNTYLSDTGYDDYAPVEIADYAFQNRTFIKRVIISGAYGFKRIGVCAFQNNTSLTSVTLCAQRVDNFAFDGCTNLSSVQLYGSNETSMCVQQLGYASFRGTAVSSVYIPKSLTSYEGGTFCNCPNLTQFTVSSENTVFAAYNYSLYSKNYATLYQYPSGRNAFYFDEQAHLSLTKISGYAFKGNNVTSRLVVPFGVKDIGAEAFSNMGSLEQLRIPSSVTTFVHNTFQYLTKLKDFYFNIKTIPSTLTGTYCFLNIKSGCKLHIPRQRTSHYSSTSPWSSSFTGGIYEDAYDHMITYNTGSALNYYLGFTVTSTASYTDTKVQSTAANGQMSITYGYVGTEGGFTGELNLPNTVSLRGKTYIVSEVDREVFRDQTLIQRVTGGNGIKKIGPLSFAGLTACTGFYLHNPVEFCDSSLFNCKATLVELGDRLQRIGKDAFRGSRIRELLMPPSVTTIGARFIAGDTNLDTLRLSPNITEIPMNGLGWVNTRYIVIPYGVKTIGKQAFFSDKAQIGGGEYLYEINCENVVVIPSSVTYIDPDAFTYARHLDDIYLNCPYGAFKTTSKYNWQRRTDYNASNCYDWSGHKLYVPVGQVQQYRNDPGIAAAWNENNDVGPGAFDFTFENNFIGTNYRMTVVDPTAKTAKYVYCEGNTSNAIVLSKTCTDHITGISYTMVEIGDSAFVKHTAATHIYLDDATSLKRIGAYALRGLTSLKQEVNVPENVTEIGTRAFYGCTALPSVFINRPYSPTTIGSYIFSSTQQTILYVPLNQLYMTAYNTSSWLSNTASNRRLLPYIKPTSEWSAISVPVSDNILLPSSGEFYYAPSYNSGAHTLNKTRIDNSKGIKGGEGMLMKGTVGTVYRFRRNDAVSSYSYVSPAINYLKGISSYYVTLSYNSSGPWYYTFDGTNMFDKVTSTTSAYTPSAYVELTSSDPGASATSAVYIENDIETYDLWIAGIQVSSENCNNLSVINGVSGTVTYNPSTKLLTLQNATIQPSSLAAGIDSEISGLKIRFIGTNIIKSYANRPAVRLNANTTMYGTGTASCQSSNNAGLYVNNSTTTVTIQGGLKLNVYGYNYGVQGVNGGKIAISGAATKVLANGLTASYYTCKTTLNDGLAITAPAGAKFNTAGTVVSSGGMVISNTDVVISKPTVTRGDVDGDGSVNISDVTALIDYLLSGNTSGVNVSAADCNQDGSVNIGDVTALIDFLLKSTW
jgi:hypothetical protein